LSTLQTQNTIILLANGFRLQETYSTLFLLQTRMQEIQIRRSTKFIPGLPPPPHATHKYGIDPSLVTLIISWEGRCYWQYCETVEEALQFLTDVRIPATYAEYYLPKT